MYYELTKPEKKAARAIIEKGVRREMKDNLRELEAIITDWRRNNKDVKETYYNVYKTLTNFDKHVARRYDGMTGSRYLLTIISQFQDGVVTDEDLSELLPTTQELVKRFKTL
ncbi:MAG: hypothetical protein ICV81_03850 [Flavisolibacter sp.]|nr:hypothetical protein [Flavisolibacter sp.]